jgi:hypothetical protein
MMSVPWSPKMKWQKELKLSAASYTAWLQTRLLVPDLPAGDVRTPPRHEIPGTYLYYAHVTLPVLEPLLTCLGNRKGQVFFNGDIVIPVIRQPREWDHDRVWMSLTPMEVFSLRPGTRLAKGHTVIAGLGMGHQLIDVTNKRNVREVTLVEKEQGLVDWVLPRIEKHLGQAPVEVIVGDAYDALKTLEADVALIDIFSSYGGNFMPYCRGIKRVWCWGAAEMG